MTIAVTTPTGNVGRHLVRLLAQAGERPRLLMRHPERLGAGARGFADPVAVDQFDPASVVAATAGVDTVYWVVPPSELDDPLEGYRRSREALLAAIRENGVRRGFDAGGSVVIETSREQSERTAALFSASGFTTDIVEDDELDATVVVATRAP